MELTAPAGPAGEAELRAHLPGLEPERHVTDWGRSELVEGALDRTLYDFLFRYWFRVEALGAEHVPSDGPVLLVANHAGVLALSGAMIAKALRQRHGVPRPVHFATERPLGTVPGLDMLLVKAGGVTAHPANLHRLLFDEHQLVLAFPEDGPNGLGARRGVRPFDRLETLRAAVRARAAIVPVAVLGAEEDIVPVLGRLGFGRLLRRARLPAAAALPLPAKLRIRFLTPAPARAIEDGDTAVRALGAELRARIQEALTEMRAERRNAWLG